MANWTCDAETRAGRLTIDGPMTVATVRLLKEALLQGFAAADQVVLDLQSAGEMDAAGLQLLCAAHRFAIDRGRGLQLVNVSERFRELAGAAGFIHGELCGIGGDTPCFPTKMA